MAMTVTTSAGTRPSRPPRRRFPSVDRAIAVVRLRHPELRGRITEGGLRVVLEREGIRVCPYLTGRTVVGRALRFLDHRAILVHEILRGAAWLAVTVHEFGHHVLHTHNAPLTEALRAEQEQFGPYVGPLYRRTEAEADAFAARLLGADYAPARAELLAFETAVEVMRAVS